MLDCLKGTKISHGLSCKMMKSSCWFRDGQDELVLVGFGVSQVLLFIKVRVQTEA